jgi:hypothetical protein
MLGPEDKTLHRALVERLQAHMRETLPPKDAKNFLEPDGDHFQLLADHSTTPCSMLDWIYREVLTDLDTFHVGDQMVGPYHVSTVFIGTHHTMFETMVFDNRDNVVPQRRHHEEACLTWNEALLMHARAVLVATGWLTAD